MSVEREFAQQLDGKRCYEFKVQEHWHKGALSDPWNVLFLRIAEGQWVRFLFDAGVFFWKREAPSLPKSSDGSEYRLVTPKIAGAVEGRTIVTADFSRLSGGGRTLTLSFDNGAMLHLVNEDDRSDVFVGGGG